MTGDSVIGHDLLQRLAGAIAERDALVEQVAFWQRSAVHWRELAERFAPDDVDFSADEIRERPPDGP
jgi:hypothetical protein